jgi:hypothetical protein
MMAAPVKDRKDRRAPAVPANDHGPAGLTAYGGRLEIQGHALDGRNEQQTRANKPGTPGCAGRGAVNACAGPVRQSSAPKVVGLTHVRMPKTLLGRRMGRLAVEPALTLNHLSVAGSRN